MKGKKEDEEEQSSLSVPPKGIRCHIKVPFVEGIPEVLGSVSLTPLGPIAIGAVNP